MDAAEHLRCLWNSGDGYLLLVRQELEERCRFYLVKDHAGEVLLEWEHDVKTVNSISCISTQEEGYHTLKVAWNSSHAVYCDYVTVGGSEAACKTELAIEVGFLVSDFYVIWSHGLILIEEVPLALLHAFATSHGRYHGYITLYSSQTASSTLAELIRYEAKHARLWVIGRKYEELTKNSAAFLNTYRVRDLCLQTSVQLPRGLTHYRFVESPAVEGLEPFTQKSIAVLSSCELLNKAVIQLFISPRTPWRETQVE